MPPVMIFNMDAFTDDLIITRFGYEYFSNI